ncbi:hypothetical protein AGMMS49545_00950 [Betaproteobacteria bacterium]|nr:hypothetical protein AGMMS49545_00950 [Betaproteobacteria bacterium]
MKTDKAPITANASGENHEGQISNPPTWERRRPRRRGWLGTENVKPAFDAASVPSNGGRRT